MEPQQEESAWASAGPAHPSKGVLAPTPDLAELPDSDSAALDTQPQPLPYELSIPPPCSLRPLRVASLVFSLPVAQAHLQ